MTATLAATTAFQRYVAEGGIMMWFLVPTAFLMIVFCIQGAINLRRARVCPRGFHATLRGLLIEPRGRVELAERLGSDGHSLGAVLGRLLLHLEVRPDADPVEVLHEEIEEECASLAQRNSQLNVIYNIAPLMGLLGTVFGMIRTFRDFTQSADPSVRDLSMGINTALITTAWGLSIAIPAYIVLYMLMRRVSTYRQVLLPEVATELLPLVTGKMRPVDEEAPAEAPDADE